MPFVFVHGVNTRAGDAYDKGVNARHKFLSQVTFPKLAFSQTKRLAFYDPYWGGEGAKPRWQNRSMPRYGDKFEAMGAAENAIADTVNSKIDFTTNDKAIILKIARKNGITAALDVLMLQLVREGATEADLKEFTPAGSSVGRFAKENEFPNWLTEVDDDDTFIYRLSREVEKSNAHPGAAAMGFGNVWERLKETAARIGNSVDDRTSQAILTLAREKLQEQATLFLGDAFVYFKNRWIDKDKARRKPEAPVDPVAIRNGLVSDVIPSIVLQALLDGNNARTKDDPYLIVMAHSMGGNIMYDLCTDFLSYVNPRFDIDLLITVGSQFSMFQEIDMFSGVKLPQQIGKDSRISKPTIIRKWINCFDKNDIFGYNASAIFDDVEDFEYDTGFGVTGAHGGYFERFSFYDRLGIRIADLLPVAAGAK